MKRRKSAKFSALEASRVCCLEMAEDRRQFLHLNEAKVAVFRLLVAVIKEEEYDKKGMVADTNIFMTSHETPLGFSNVVQNSISQRQ
jgi:hypothetical protein